MRTGLPVLHNPRTTIYRKLSQMKCFQNIDNFEGRSRDSGGPPVRVCYDNNLSTCPIVVEENDL